MTRARITAAQATRPPKGMRMHRGTVTAVSPLTVQIAGGGAVTGLAVPGQKYTVGDAVLVAVQEPAVGPVYPLAPTAPADLTVYAKTTDLAPYAKTTDLSVYAKSTDLPATVTGTITYAGTFRDFGSPRVSTISRFGPLATLIVQATVGTAPTSGTVILTLPAGFRPIGPPPVTFRTALFTGTWGGQSVDFDLATDGRLIFQGASAAVAAGHTFFGTITYPAA